jgi:hypothetical protein
VVEGKITRKAAVAVLVIVLCVVLVAVLLITAKPDAVLIDENQPSLYVASYTPGLSETSHIDGNIVLVNPTNRAYSNLSLSIQLDNYEITKPTLRIWDPNYSLNTPTSFLQSVQLYRDMLNHSTPITTINLEPNQNLTLWLNLTSQGTIRFNLYNLRIFLSQHDFGDLVNGQSFTLPQTEVHLQIISYSPVQTDNDTYHKYFSSSLNRYVYRNDNPNFYQRYRNHSLEIGISNYGMAAEMGVLGVRYFNVTVQNNSTFPVNSIKLLGQLPSGGNYTFTWSAIADYVLQPGETHLFPVGEKELPTNAYATGYITNSPNK